jgi:hypothetical protein
MAQKLRTLREFNDKEFVHAMIAALEEDKALLMKLAKV